MEGTPFDFRHADRHRRAHRRDPHQQITLGGGYDHNMVLDRARQPALAHAARVNEPTTGRTMDI